jgi:hypothetical protein
MKSSGSGGIAPLILNLITRCRGVFSLTPRPLSSPEGPPPPLLVLIVSWAECALQSTRTLWRKEESFHYWESNCGPPRSLLTIPAALSQLLLAAVLSSVYPFGWMLFNGLKSLIFFPLFVPARPFSETPCSEFLYCNRTTNKVSFECRTKKHGFKTGPHRNSAFFFSRTLRTVFRSV